jgi:TetR/AcrR family transcriptional repressor of nem operon
MIKNQTSQEQILTIAERLIQTKGYHAFSYRDIADEVNIKTSSIHYHFPTKADLGKAVVQKHLEGLSELVKPLLEDEKLSSRQKLGIFIDTLVAKTYGDHQKMCLGGMLASDALTLPEPIKKEVQQFFSRLTTWLKQLLTEALARNECKLEKKNIAAEATFMLAHFEGSLLLARLYKDEGYLAAARRQIMARLN